MGKVGCDIWEKWVGGRKSTRLPEPVASSELELSLVEVSQQLFSSQAQLDHPLVLVHLHTHTKCTEKKEVQ